VLYFGRIIIKEITLTNTKKNVPHRKGRIRALRRRERPSRRIDDLKDEIQMLEGFKRNEAAS